MVNLHADYAGFEQGGYKLVFQDHPTAASRAAAGAATAINVWYSIGIRINPDGSITDVRWNGPADKSQLAPGMKVLAVNGTIFSGDALRSAIKDAKGKTEPIHLIVQSQTSVANFDIDYHDGERYPALERIPNTPAYLDDITTPLTTPEKVAENPSAAQ
jgi:predicted metalloprotease with PDZ domain